MNIYEVKNTPQSKSGDLDANVQKQFINKRTKGVTQGGHLGEKTKNHCGLQAAERGSRCGNVTEAII